MYAISKTKPNRPKDEGNTIFINSFEDAIQHFNELKDSFKCNAILYADEQHRLYTCADEYPTVDNIYHIAMAPIMIEDDLTKRISRKCVPLFRVVDDRNKKGSFVYTPPTVRYFLSPVKAHVLYTRLKEENPSVKLYRETLWNSKPEDPREVFKEAVIIEMT